MARWATAAGRRTRNRAPPPGASCALIVPWWASDDVVRNREAEARLRPCRARGRPRPARSGRTGLVRARGQAGAVIAHAQDDIAVLPCQRTTSIGVPAGVCTSALRSRFASTWLSWCGVARDDRLVGRAHLDRTLGCGRAGVGDGVARRALRHRPARAAARAPHRAVRASAGPRRGRPSVRTPPRSVASRVSVRLAILGRSHTEQLGVAAYRGERGAQLV